MSFRVIGEVVGVSEQTAACRYRALHAAGVLRVLALPDPRHVATKTWHVRIGCAPRVIDRLAEVLARREDVSWVSTTGGGDEITCTTQTDPLTSRPSALLHALPRTLHVERFAAFAMLTMHLGGDAEWLGFDDPLTRRQVGVLERATRDRRRGPSHVDPLDEADAPLVAALAVDGRATVAALVRNTGWSKSRVSARVAQLFAAGMMHTELDVAPQAFGFESSAFIWVTVAPADLVATGRALAEHRESGFVAAVTGAANLLCAVNCRDDDELYEYVTTRIGALPAVRQAEIVPVLERLKQAGTRVRGGRLVVAGS